MKNTLRKTEKLFYKGDVEILFLYSLMNKVETVKGYLMDNEKNLNGKFILNYKRVTVWGRDPGIYWTFNTIDEAMGFINKDEKLKDNFTLEVVTCKV